MPPRLVRADAIKYISEGLFPTPVGAGSNHPYLVGWPGLEFTETTVHAYFSDDANIALVHRDGIVGIDPDHPIARRIAGRFLPPTHRISGRKSAGASRYYYRLPSDRPAKSRSFSHPKAGMLVELLGDRSASLAPPSVHKSGEVVEWLNEGELGTTTYGALLNCTVLIAIATLLAHFYPAPGLRHEYTLAYAARLLKDGVTPDDLRFVTESLCEVAADPELPSRLADGASTSARLSAGEPVTAPGRLDELAGAVVERYITRWLGGSRELPAVQAGLTAVDLGSYFGVLSEPKEIEPRLIFKGMVHCIVGEPGSGKTFWALHIAKSVAESGPMMTAARLKAMGMPAELASTGVTYVPFPGMGAKDAGTLLEMARDHQPDLVILDATADFLAAAGMDENAASDVTRWFDAFVLPLAREFGAAVVLLDHGTKNGKSNGPRGSSAKTAKADIVLEFNRPSPFSAVLVTTVWLKRLKDRSGLVRDSAMFRMGGTQSGFIVERLSDAQITAASANRSEAIYGFLAARGLTGATNTEVVEAVSLNRSRVSDYLKDLVESHRVRVESRSRQRYYVAIVPTSETTSGNAVGSVVGSGTQSTKEADPSDGSPLPLREGDRKGG